MSSSTQLIEDGAKAGGYLEFFSLVRDAPRLRKEILKISL